MKLGLFMPTFRDWADLAAIRRLVTVCEERGLDSVWIPDRVAFPVGLDEASEVRPMSTWLKRDQSEEHWGQHGGGYRADEKVGEAFKDVYVMAGAVAAMTEQLEIGTSIALVPHRNPIATARTIATLDQVTGGRFHWGVDTGHVKGEYEALNLDYADRHDMLDEWLRCMVALWTEDPADFHGHWWDFTDLRMLLAPVSRPHPPILIGGNSKRALRVGARVGGWVPAYLRPNEMAVGVDFLREEMESIGRKGEPDVTLLSRFRLSEKELPPTPNSRPVHTPEALAELIGQFESAGCKSFVAHVPTRNLETMEEQVELLAEAGRIAAGAPEPDGGREVDPAAGGGDRRGVGQARDSRGRGLAAAPEHGERAQAVPPNDRVVGSDQRPAGGLHGPARDRPWLADERAASTNSAADSPS